MQQHAETRKGVHVIVSNSDEETTRLEPIAL